MVHTLELYFLTHVYPNGSPFLLPYLGYNMTYEPTIHMRDL